MDLTTPVLPEALRLAFPRDTRGMEEEELWAMLRVEERALRSLYGVTATDADTDLVLADAMLAAWPSFLQQVRQVAQEDASATGHSVTYNRAGVIDFTFPSFVGTILASVSDAAQVPSASAVTQLVR